MAQTVIGMFDNAGEAQRALEHLQQRGISRDRIDLSRGATSSNVSDSRSSDSDRSSNSFTNFFRNLFGADNDDADRYSRVAERSDTIVTVHAASQEEASMAASILDECGAVDVDARARAYGFSGSSRSDLSSGDDRRDISGTSGPDTTIQRMEERLDVGKRSEERGNIHVRSRIVEKPVEEHVRLREEHIHVERQQVDRPVNSGDFNQFQERDIELTERAEVPVVNKEARVVEEIRISKDVTERDETIRDTVRRTDIDIDDKSNESYRGVSGDRGDLRNSDDLRSGSDYPDSSDFRDNSDYRDNGKRPGF